MRTETCSTSDCQEVIPEDLTRRRNYCQTCREHRRPLVGLVAGLYLGDARYGIMA